MSEGVRDTNDQTKPPRREGSGGVRTIRTWTVTSTGSLGSPRSGLTQGHNPLHAYWCAVEWCPKYVRKHWPPAKGAGE